MNESGENGGAPSGAEETHVGAVGEERTWRVRPEQLRVTSGELWGKLRQLVHEGNVRRIIVRGHGERVLIDIPVTVGVVGTVLAPFAVAIAAVAAVATRCTIEVERIEEEEASAAEDEGATGAEATAETETTDTPPGGETSSAGRAKRTKS